MSEPSSTASALKGRGAKRGSTVASASTTKTAPSESNALSSDVRPHDTASDDICTGTTRNPVGTLSRASASLGVTELPSRPAAHAKDTISSAGQNHPEQGKTSLGTSVIDFARHYTPPRATVEPITAYDDERATNTETSQPSSEFDPKEQRVQLATRRQNKGKAAMGTEAGSIGALSSGGHNIPGKLVGFPRQKQGRLTSTSLQPLPEHPTAQSTEPQASETPAPESFDVVYNSLLDDKIGDYQTKLTTKREALQLAAQTGSSEVGQEGWDELAAIQSELSDSCARRMEFAEMKEYAKQYPNQLELEAKWAEDHPEYAEAKKKAEKVQKVIAKWKKKHPGQSE
ncbi:hypothetical protein IAU59_007409 [Kwoniella sp. CBS 9459]